MSRSWRSRLLSWLFVWMERGSSACFLLAFQCEVFLRFISLEKRVQVEHEFYQFRVNVVFVTWAKLFESQVVSFGRRSCCLWTYWVCCLAWTKPFCSRTTALCLAMWTTILDQVEVDFCPPWSSMLASFLEIVWNHLLLFHAMLHLGRRCRALLYPMVRTKAPSGRPMPLCKTSLGLPLMHDAHNARLKIWRLSARHCKVFFIVVGANAKLLQSYAVTLPDTFTHCSPLWFKGPLLRYSTEVNAGAYSWGRASHITVVLPPLSS